MKNVLYRALLCFLTLMILMSGTFAALSEGIDLNALEDSEIVDLLERVTEEMVKRGIEKTAKLPKGTYIAGRDLPCGRYVYTCLAKGDDWGNVTVYSDRGAGKQLLWNVVSAPDEGEEPDTIFLTLNEGDELKSGVPFSLTIMTGVIFR